MIPLDQWEKSMLSKEMAMKFLSNEEQAAFDSIESSAREVQLKELLEKPIQNFTVVNELYFRAKWAGLVGELYGSRPVTLLEVASGDADMIPQALARSNPGSIYITANMNQKLNESLLKKTEGLELSLQLVDDDAINIGKNVKEASVDIVAFQHGVNDVLQAILCGQHGVDTIYNDWMECLPEMIRLLKEEIKAGTLEANVKLPFLALLKELYPVLKKGGMIAIHHYMFQLDLDWGYPPHLFEHLIPIIREWFKELTWCKEVKREGYSPQWWIFLQI